VYPLGLSRVGEMVRCRVSCSRSITHRLANRGEGRPPLREIPYEVCLEASTRRTYARLTRQSEGAVLAQSAIVQVDLRHGPGLEELRIEEAAVC
jgi:hypothetical protein